MRIRSLRGKHADRILQREVQHRFGRQLDLLSFGRRLYAATKSAAGGRANSSTFATAGKSADNGANRCAGTDLLRCVLSARTPLALVLIGLNAIRPAADGNPIQLQYDHRLPGKLACALDVDQVAFDVIAGRNGHLAIHRER